MEWREADGVRWLEVDLPGATAAFSARVGGSSGPPFDSLNLCVFTEDERETVAENRVRLAAALGFEPERIAIGRQVHGAELATHSGPQGPSPFAEPGSAIPEVDGHVTAEPSFALLVSSPTACRWRSPDPVGWRCCIAAGAAWRLGSSPAAWRQSAQQTPQ